MNNKYFNEKKLKLQKINNVQLSTIYFFQQRSTFSEV